MATGCILFTIRLVYEFLYLFAVLYASARSSWFNYRFRLKFIKIQWGRIYFRYLLPGKRARNCLVFLVLFYSVNLAWIAISNGDI